MATQLNAADTQSFLQQFANDPTLQGYLNSPPYINAAGQGISLHSPPYGVIINGSSTRWLVWFDASNQLHVFDMSDQPAVADQIAKPDYHTADESFIYNVTQEVENFVQGLPTLPTLPQLFDWSTVALFAVGAFLVYRLFK